MTRSTFLKRFGAAAALAAFPAAGAVRPAERRTYADPVTGYRVTEITGPGLPAGNLYNHFSNFTADNRYLIFAGREDGATRLYRYAVESGEILRLTEDPAIAAGAACPDPREPRRVFAVRGPEVLAIDVETGAARRVGLAPGAGGFSQPTVSHDGRSLALGRQVDERTWEIGVMEIATGAYRVVLRQGFRIGHVQHSPTAPVIFYVWETAGYAPQRSWLVNADGSGNRPFYAATDPKKWITPLKEWMTHESWVAGTGQMTMIHDQVGVVMVEPDGASRVVREGRYWHAAARGDGRYIAIDDMQGRIWLAETATANIRLLATGIRDRVPLHGHLSFDRQGRFVQFQTGREHETVALFDLSQIAEYRR